MDFDETITIESIFGEIEIKYYPAVKEELDFSDFDKFLTSTPPHPSYYRATMKTGDYKGIIREDLTRGTAIGELLIAVSEVHTRDLAKRYGILT